VKGQAATWNVCPKCGGRLYSGFIVHVCPFVKLAPMPRQAESREPADYESILVTQERTRLLEEVATAARVFEAVLTRYETATIADQAVEYRHYTVALERLRAALAALEADGDVT
jgi:hypothetical protein